MMIIINNTVPFLGIMICVFVLIRVKYRTMEIDSILLMLLFIISFTVLADADIKNKYTPVWETVTARIIQIIIVLFIMSVVKRFTKMRIENRQLKKAITDLTSKSKLSHKINPPSGERHERTTR